LAKTLITNYIKFALKLLNRDIKPLIDTYKVPLTRLYSRHLYNSILNHCALRRYGHDVALNLWWQFVMPRLSQQKQTAQR